MNPIIDRMAAFPEGLRSLVGGLPDADASWKPSVADWSVREVVWHLADEEELDFPARLRLTVHAPGEAWAPIDPEGWARERSYNGRPLDEALSLLAARRSTHVAWLRTLTPADLEREYHHPEWGPVPASVLFASWCAHDALHLRQVAKRLYQLVGRDAPGVDLRYAGEW